MAVARELTQALRDLCEPEKFKWAGSLRRMKPEVGDIELVYVPRIEQRKDPADLLGKEIPTNLVDEKLDELLRAGVLERRVGEKGGTSWGEQNKLAVHKATGIGIDFFAAETSKRNFHTLLVCRTGSQACNTRLCMAAIERGWQWDPYRGIRDRRTKELLYVPDSERGLFEYLGLPYLEPSQRI